MTLTLPFPWQGVGFLPEKQHLPCMITLGKELLLPYQQPATGN